MEFKIVHRRKKSYSLEWNEDNLNEIMTEIKFLGELYL